MATSELEAEFGVAQPYQSPQTARNEMAPSSATSPAALQPVSVLARAASNSTRAISCPADPRGFPGSLVLSFQLF